MEFFSTITESTLLGRSILGASKYSAKDYAEILFAYICAIRILKAEFHGGSSIAGYLSKSKLQADGSLKGNDLDVLINLLFSDKAAKTVKYKDDEDSRHYINSITFNMPTLRTFINQAIRGDQNIEFDRRFLLYAENQLKISNGTLSAIRRLCGEWELEDESDHILVFTRLIQFLRSKAKKTDIVPILEKISKKTGLEDKDIDNRQQQQPQQPKKTNQADAGKSAVVGAGYYAGGKAIGKGLAK